MNHYVRSWLNVQLGVYILKPIWTVFCTNQDSSLLMYGSMVSLWSLRLVVERLPACCCRHVSQPGQPHKGLQPSLSALDTHNAQCPLVVVIWWDKSITLDLHWTCGKQAGDTIDVGKTCCGLCQIRQSMGTMHQTTTWLTVHNQVHDIMHSLCLLSSQTWFNLNEINKFLPLHDKVW